MSRGIVSQKGFSRKKRKSFKKMMNRSGISIPEIKINSKFKNILSRGMGFTLLIIIGIIILVKSLFFKPEQTISQVKFSEDTLATYQNPYLFDYIASVAKGKNYYLFNADKDNLLSKIQNGYSIRNLSGNNIEFKFPFVGNIELQLEPTTEIEESTPEKIIIGIKISGNEQGKGFLPITTDFPLKNSTTKDKGGTLGVKLSYYEPSALVKLNDKEFAVWDESTYVEIKEGMLLGIRSPEEEPLFIIESPQYLTGTSNLDGYFFEISLSKMLQIANLAKEEFGNNMLRFVYLAGSTRFAIFTSDQRTLYFNFPEGGNVEDQRNSQIFKYNTLKERYENFGNIDKIDLGSLENNKTIIMNY